MSVRPITIDVVSDVVCPWCYVGKRRLETVLRRRPDLPVRVRWYPFQLDPAIPPGGLDRRSYMLQKFGSQQRIDEIHERLTAVGRAEGLAFGFDRIRRAVNTLDAHRLITWASKENLASEATEALMRAYFMEGNDIGNPTVLGDIAGQIGMDAEAVAAALLTDQDRSRVQSEIGQAMRLGVTGVPFFIFDQSFAVPGAQSVEILASALDRAIAEQRDPAPTVLQA